MSWLDKINDPYIIQTGDSKQFTVLWKKASTEWEYNVALFDFIDVEGTLVKRNLKRGNRYEIEFWFVGENCLTDAESFDQSAKDSRPWVISHPFYNVVVVQPLKIFKDNSELNVTRYVVDCIETITEKGTKTTLDPSDSIAYNKDLLDEKARTQFNNTSFLKNVNTVTKTLNNGAKYAQRAITLPSQANEYRNAINAAVSSALNLTTAPSQALTTIQGAINYPSIILTSAQTRVEVLQNQFDTLRAQRPNLTGASGSSYYLFAGASIVSSVAKAVSSPARLGAGNTNLANLTPFQDAGVSDDDIQSANLTAYLPDYLNKADVFNIIQKLTTIYNTFVAEIDDLQSDTGGNLDSFIPDPDTLVSLSDLVNLTISNLFTIALGLRSERSFINEEDSNCVLLAHRVYGLQSDDSTLNEFILTNKIGLNELLIIPKGRKIVYYV